MSYLDNISIRRQLTWIILLTTGAALFVAIAAFAWHDVRNYRGDLAAQSATRAEIVGNLCTAALTFGGADIAREAVGGLRADPHVMAVVLFDAAGKPFASYARPGLPPAALPARPLPPGVRFSPDHLTASHRIQVDKEVLGTVMIQLDLEELRARKAGYLLLILTVLLGAGGLATVLSARLQRIISGPILALAGTARTVAREKHYAVRAQRLVGGEIGLLVDDFNEMLAQIQTRDAALKQAQAELEQRVLERTQALQTEITERQRAETVLKQNEAELSVIYEHAPVMMFLLNEQGRVHRLNRAAADFSGRRLDQAVGLAPGAVLNCVPAAEDPRGCGFPGACDACELRRAFRDTFHNGQTYRRMEVALKVFRNQRPAGVVLLASTARVEVANQPMVLICLEDISDRKLLEGQLRQAQKLEAIGQLAGGVAHDFNNILAAMIMQLDLLQQGPNLAPEIRSALMELEAGADRAASMTRQLLLFGRQQVMQVKRLDLNELLANLLKLLRRLLGERIDLTFRGKTGPLWIDADASMMDQVVMNLCVNARDAMPNGGRLTIDTHIVELGAEAARTNAEARPGRFACLSVADTGCGMDDETKKRIFEPFFTTKEVGQGTGLGLATVYGIAQQHRGWVEVRSQAGQGSVFRVFLPAQSVMPPALATAAAPVPRGDETVLVVEDDDALRKIAVLGLRRSGYRVLEAANGQEALRRWEEHAGQIALLLTDMVMPGEMTGLELAHHLRQKASGLKVIISSGYSPEITKLGLPTELGITYLPKPYTLATLATVVREHLDQR